MAPEERLFETLKRKVGKEVGVTDWFSISQMEADMFGPLTCDWDPMHNDPEWAKTSPWGNTIAHGFHLLSLISWFNKAAAGLPILSNERVYALNYGLDRVRFISPFRIGKRARDHVSLTAITEKRPGEFLVKTTHKVIVEGEAKPAMIAEHLALFVVGKHDAVSASAAE
jgi:acyl dehydratase